MAQQTNSQPVNVLADAQAEIDALNRRMDDVRREMRSYRGDKSHLRDKLRRMAAERDQVGRAALARVQGGAA